MKQLHRLFSTLIMLGMIFSLFSMPASTAQAQEGDPELAPLYTAEADKVVPGQYIVVFKDEMVEAATVTAAAAEVSAQGAEVQFVYTSAIKGFAAKLTPEMVTALRSDSRVEFIEEDQIVTINDDEGPSAQSVQAGAVWGLDRIDQTSATLDGNFYYPASAGEGVHAYVIDSGIRTTHNEFGGRATLDYDAIQDGQNGLPTCEPHGTHVAGTIGGSTYGVAKNVTLHGVRVLGCDGFGYTSWIAAGVDWVALNHIKPAVANMSLGGYGASPASEKAINGAIAKGVTFVVAAGNNNYNACFFSPARVPAAITVGATDSTDTRADFSNYGSCVDIFAPGVSITSAINDSDSATDIWDGTSMASPHVAGAVALYLAGNPTAKPATVTAFIIAQSTKNKVVDPAGSPNRLLYVNNTVSVAPVLVTPLLNALTGDNDPTLTWKSVTYANEYQVQIAGNSTFTISPTLIAGLSDPTYTFPDDALADGKWYWRARAVSAYSVAGPWSAARYFTVDTTAPAVPVLKLPTTGATVNGTPTFSWGASATATRYQFEYNTANDSSAFVYQSGELTTVSHKPTTPVNPGTYYWFVRAKDAAGNWSAWSNTATTVIIKALKPATPVLLAPITNFFTNDTTPELAWKTAAYASIYQVQISPFSNFYSGAFIDKEVSGTTFTDADYDLSTLYQGKWYWRVRGRNVDGIDGPWSAVRYFTVDTTAPAAPVLKLPAVGATTTGMPIFSWAASVGAKYYVVTTDIGATYTSTQLTVLSHKPLVALQGSGNWSVKAIDAAGNESAFSAPRAITINPATPGKPVLSTPAIGAQTDDTTVDLAWSAATYAATYDVQVDNLATFVSPEYSTTGVVGTSQTTSALSAGKWYWRVRARNSSGVYGAWSTSRYFTVLPSFNSQFNSAGNLEGWTGHYGAWNVSGGYLSTTGLYDGYTSSASYPATFTNFTYEARLKMGYNALDVYSASYYGLVVRGTPTFNSWYDWKTAYYFRINQYVDDYGYSEGCYDVWKITNGIWTRLTPYGSSWCSGVINVNDWNDLKVTASGKNLKFYINDNLMWSGTQASPLSGRLGVFSWYNGYDDYFDFTGRNTSMDVDWAVAGQPVITSLDEQVLPGQWTSNRFSAPKSTK